jgi:hypothetical protein
MTLYNVSQNDGLESYRPVLVEDHKAVTTGDNIKGFSENEKVF